MDTQVSDYNALNKCDDTKLSQIILEIKDLVSNTLDKDWKEKIINLLRAIYDKKFFEWREKILEYVKNDEDFKQFLDEFLQKDMPKVFDQKEWIDMNNLNYFLFLSSLWDYHNTYNCFISSPENLGGLLDKQIGRIMECLNNKGDLEETKECEDVDLFITTINILSRLADINSIYAVRKNSTNNLLNLLEKKIQEILELQWIKEEKKAELLKKLWILWFKYSHIRVPDYNQETTAQSKLDKLTEVFKKHKEWYEKSKDNLTEEEKKRYLINLYIILLDFLNRISSDDFTKIKEIQTLSCIFDEINTFLNWKDPIHLDEDLEDTKKFVYESFLKFQWKENLDGYIDDCISKYPDRISEIESHNLYHLIKFSKHKYLNKTKLKQLLDKLNPLDNDWEIDDEKIPDNFNNRIYSYRLIDIVFKRLYNAIPQELWGDAKFNAEYFDEVIKEDRVYPVYQPICDSTWKIVKYEVLMRIEENRREINPYNFMNWAIKHWKLQDLMEKMMDKVIKKAREHPNLNFSINLTCSEIKKECEPDIIASIQNKLEIEWINPEKITFEIVEEKLEVEEKLLKNIKDLKDKWYKISLDDFWSGEANICELITLVSSEMVDYIKIDWWLVDDIMSIDWDFYLEKLIKYVIILAKQKWIKVIAEKIENQETFEKMRDLWVDLFQWFWLWKPEKDTIEKVQELEAGRFFYPFRLRKSPWNTLHNLI